MAILNQNGAPLNANDDAMLTMAAETVKKLAGPLPQHIKDEIHNADTPELFYLLRKMVLLMAQKYAKASSAPVVSRVPAYIEYARASMTTKYLVGEIEARSEGRSQGDTGSTDDGMAKLREIVECIRKQAQTEGTSTMKFTVEEADRPDDDVCNCPICVQEREADKADTVKADETVG